MLTIDAVSKRFASGAPAFTAGFMVSAMAMLVSPNEAALEPPAGLRSPSLRLATSPGCGVNAETA